MHLRPIGLLLLDGSLEEVVRGFGGLGSELIGSPPLGDQAEIVCDSTYDAGFFPGLALGSILGCGFVRLPATFGEYPAAATC